MPMFSPMLTMMVAEAMIASIAAQVWKQMYNEEVQSVEYLKALKLLHPSQHIKVCMFVPLLQC
jgi:hypothetical protein